MYGTFVRGKTDINSAAMVTLQGSIMDSDFGAKNECQIKPKLNLALNVDQGSHVKPFFKSFALLVFFTNVLGKVPCFDGSASR